MPVITDVWVGLFPTFPDMHSNPFEAPGCDHLRRMDGRLPTAPEDLFRRPGRGGRPRRPTEASQSDEEAAEPLEIDAAPAPEGKPKEESKAVLSEPAWLKDWTRFHEEAEVSVKLTLPQAKKGLTRVEVELYAAGSEVPNPIAKAQAHAMPDGTAVFTLPIYKPQGHEEGPARYFLVFKHALAKVLKTDSLLREVSETALRSTDHAVVPGIVFAKDSSFIPPDAAGELRRVEGRFTEWEKKYPKGRIVLFGHANPDEKTPKALSERRAQSVHAFITNDAATWEKLYLAEAWGLKALQNLLKDLGQYAGRPDGEVGPKTQAALKALQKKSGLPETGKEDPATRKALFAAYMAGKHDVKLDAGRFRTVAASPWMGCAAHNRPRPEGGITPGNRRVTFILVNESRFFPLHFPCQDGSEAACQRQCKRQGPRSGPGIGCLFYDELVREEKQAAAEGAPEVHDIPWMALAEKEAGRWKGETEDVISKTINYHKEVGLDLASLSGTDHAWCASFVNYCLKQAGYAMSTIPCRARSFAGDPNFTEIDEPTFGSIALIGTHHVCFVYAKDEQAQKPICLGGNQSDQINFTTFREKTRYFLPKQFDPSKHTLTPLDSTTASNLNAQFGIVAKTKQGNNTR